MTNKSVLVPDRGRHPHHVDVRIGAGDRLYHRVHALDEQPQLVLVRDQLHARDEVDGQLHVLEGRQAHVGSPERVRVHGHHRVGVRVGDPVRLHERVTAAKVHRQTNSVRESLTRC